VLIAIARGSSDTPTSAGTIACWRRRLDRARDAQAHARDEDDVASTNPRRSPTRAARGEELHHDGEREHEAAIDAVGQCPRES
jgi:hypothetical protein